MDAFNRILSKLNDLDSVEHSVAYIRDEVKPGFNQWEGKDEYEARFMELIERRFN